MSNPNPQLPTCPTCKGSGNCQCTECQVRTAKDCPTCHGTGKAPVCPACGGNRLVTRGLDGHLENCPNSEFHKAAEAPTRVTVIPPKGLAQEWWNVKVRLDYQDDGRTLKIFMEER